jgi:hypothetical protein
MRPSCPISASVRITNVSDGPTSGQQGLGLNPIPKRDSTLIPGIFSDYSDTVCFVCAVLGG